MEPNKIQQVLDALDSHLRGEWTAPLRESYPYDRLGGIIDKFDARDLEYHIRSANRIRHMSKWEFLR